MIEDDWPPGQDEYVPRRLMERLESLSQLTDVRQTGYTDGIATVGVWPFTSEVEEAVRGRVAPLPVEVFAVPVLPRRY